MAQSIKDLMNKNIKNVQQHVICLEPSELINKDSNQLDFLRINLHKMDLRNKHINSFKLEFVSKKMDDKSVVSQKYIDSELINTKYNLMCGYNLILNDYFYQNENLLPDGLILPIKYLNEDHSICINIINIGTILYMLNNYLELHISFTEIEFEEEFDKLMPTMLIEQLIQTKNNTFNVFRVMCGMGNKATFEDLPKDEFNKYHKNYKL